MRHRNKRLKELDQQTSTQYTFLVLSTYKTVTDVEVTLNELNRNTLSQHERYYLELAQGIIERFKSHHGKSFTEAKEKGIHHIEDYDAVIQALQEVVKVNKKYHHFWQRDRLGRALSGALGQAPQHRMVNKPFSTRLALSLSQFEKQQNEQQKPRSRVARFFRSMFGMINRKPVLNRLASPEVIVTSGKYVNELQSELDKAENVKAINAIKERFTNVLDLDIDRDALEEYEQFIRDAYVQYKGKDRQGRTERDHALRFLNFACDIKTTWVKCLSALKNKQDLEEAKSLRTTFFQLLIEKGHQLEKAYRGNAQIGRLVAANINRLFQSFEERFLQKLEQIKHAKVEANSAQNTHAKESLKIETLSSDASDNNRFEEERMNDMPSQQVYQAFYTNAELKKKLGILPEHRQMRWGETVGEIFRQSVTFVGCDPCFEEGTSLSGDRQKEAVQLDQYLENFIQQKVPEWYQQQCGGIVTLKNWLLVNFHDPMFIYHLLSSTTVSYDSERQENSSIFLMNNDTRMNKDHPNKGAYIVVDFDQENAALVIQFDKDLGVYSVEAGDYKPNEHATLKIKITPDCRDLQALKAHYSSQYELRYETTFTKKTEKQLRHHGPYQQFLQTASIQEEKAAGKQISVKRRQALSLSQNNDNKRLANHSTNLFTERPKTEKDLELGGKKKEIQHAVVRDEREKLKM